MAGLCVVDAGRPSLHRLGFREEPDVRSGVPEPDLVDLASAELVALPQSDRRIEHERARIARRIPFQEYVIHLPNLSKSPRDWRKVVVPSAGVRIHEAEP